LPDAIAPLAQYLRRARQRLGGSPWPRCFTAAAPLPLRCCSAAGACVFRAEAATVGERSPRRQHPQAHRKRGKQGERSGGALS